MIMLSGGMILANTIVVVGMQWGDEGKGKITDFLAGKADVVVRCQGGNNAGHTVYFDHQKYALHLLPSGVFNPRVVNIMASGMVVHPKALLAEMAQLSHQGVNDYQVYLSDRAHVVMPYHLILDELIEQIRGADAIGTTKKGIGPAYMDKTGRFGIRVCDLLDETRLFNQISVSLAFYNPVLAAFGSDTFDAQALTNEYHRYGVQLRDRITDTGVMLRQLIKENKYILFEGAQGSMLCLDHGTYPFVTSSSPTATSVPLNAGIAPREINRVIGVTKAYSTRVGAGVFPTEITDQIASTIRERGKEYGTTTGRPRRIGWLDGVVIRYGAHINGTTGLALTLLDVLSGLDELKICVAYRLDGNIIDHVPANYQDYLRVEPIYESFPGWQDDISTITLYDALPENCKKYLQAIEMYTETKIAVLSLGPDRTQTVVLDPSIQ